MRFVPFLIALVVGTHVVLAQDMLQFERVIEINAPATEVWKQVGSFFSPELWNPVITRTRMMNAQSLATAVRQVTYSVGGAEWITVDRVSLWNPTFMSMSWNVQNEQNTMLDAQVQLDVDNTGEYTSAVRILAAGSYTNISLANLLLLALEAGAQELPNTFDPQQMATCSHYFEWGSYTKDRTPYGEPISFHVLDPSSPGAFKNWDNQFTSTIPHLCPNTMWQFRRWLKLNVNANVRCLGTWHSGALPWYDPRDGGVHFGNLEDMYPSLDYIISTVQLRRLLDMDVESGRITVEPGLDAYFMLELLEQAGFHLHLPLGCVMGTMAGLIATASAHSGHYGTLSGDVSNITFIGMYGMARGEVREGIPLAAGAVHLGLLGPVESIVFQAVPATKYRRHSFITNNALSTIWNESWLAAHVQQCEYNNVYVNLASPELRSANASEPMVYGYCATEAVPVSTPSSGGQSFDISNIGRDLHTATRSQNDLGNALMTTLYGSPAVGQYSFATMSSIFGFFHTFLDPGDQIGSPANFGADLGDWVEESHASYVGQNVLQNCFWVCVDDYPRYILMLWSEVHGIPDRTFIDSTGPGVGNTGGWILPWSPFGSHTRFITREPNILMSPANLCDSVQTCLDRPAVLAQGATGYQNALRFDERLLRLTADNFATGKRPHWGKTAARFLNESDLIRAYGDNYINFKAFLEEPTDRASDGDTLPIWVLAICVGGTVVLMCFVLLLWRIRRRGQSDPSGKISI